MKFFGFLFNQVWPLSGKYEDLTINEDIEKIRETKWQASADVFLEEARRLRDIETSRKNSADTKSQIYLGALLALVPVSISIADLQWFKNTLASETWFSTIAVILLVAGVLYGVASFYYALKTLKVAAYNRIDIEELSDSASSDKPVQKVVEHILLTVRRDRVPINKKVGLVKQTQSHIARMILVFFILFIVMILTPQNTELLNAVSEFLSCIVDPDA